MLASESILEADEGTTAVKVRRRRGSASPRPSNEKRLREVESRVSVDEDASLEAPQRITLDSAQLDSAQSFAARYSDVRRELPRALPFMAEPGYRSFAANVPGDGGFDPLGLCTDVKKFASYREAELKHGRLAMLAAAIWPLAELGDQNLVEENQPALLGDSGGRMVPEITGDGQFVEYLIAIVLLVGSAFELNFTRPAGKAPGDYNFDPLGLKNFKPPSWARSLLPLRRLWMPEAELKHGRIAMLAVLYFIVDEVLTGNPVIEDTEVFFHRLDTKLLRWEYWTLQPDVLDVAEAGMDAIS